MSRPDPPAAVAAVGLDLGSTRIKAARLDATGRLTGLGDAASPPLSGRGGIREGDALAYVREVGRLLDSVAVGVPAGTPLGIASQRSTFVLWDRAGGEPLRPMVSWQDSRGSAWCARHADSEPEISRRTGLVLSGHYAGPKLAALQESEPELAARLRDGSTLFGTLETFLVWRRTGGRAHITDPSMAARTLLYDLDERDWSPWLLETFGMPAAVLPRVVPTSGRELALDNGLSLTASVADQAAGLLSVFDENADGALVNLGTGGFVLVPSSRHRPPRPGYLTGPVVGGDRRAWRFAWEGTINGAGTAVDRYGAGPTDLPDTDPDPEGFCVPDTAGLGAPYWRPDVGLRFSDGAEPLDAQGKRRIVLEGLLFRIREVLDDLCPAGLPGRILLSGGLAREPFIAAGLATLLARRVERLEMQEGALTGAARLAAGLASPPETEAVGTEPSAAGAYLKRKYPRWREWLRGLLSPRSR